MSTNSSRTRKWSDPGTSCKKFKSNSDNDQMENQLMTNVLPSGKDFTRECLESKSTSELYELLWDVDRERAERLQPNDRRKILR